MKSIACIVVLAVVLASPAAAQPPRAYLGMSAATELGTRGLVDVTVVGAVGVVAGLRLSEAWSVELQIDRGFGSSVDARPEALVFAQADRPLTTEELDRLGVFGRTVTSDSTGAGYSVIAVWRTRDPGRVNAAFFGGVSTRRFFTRRVQTITRIGPGVTYPPDHPNLQNTDEVLDRSGGGYTAGALVPIRIRRNAHVAPELAVTLGVIPDDSRYFVVRTGVKLLWGF